MTLSGDVIVLHGDDSIKASQPVYRSCSGAGLCGTQLGKGDCPKKNP